MKVEKEELVTKTIKLCDVCNKEIKFNGMDCGKKCSGCGIDICSDCTDYEHYDIWHGGGENSRPYCESCRVKLKKYIPLAKKITEKYDQEIEKLYKDFLGFCEIK